MPLDAGNGYIVYARFDKEDCAVIAINCSDKDVSLTVPVWTVIDNRTDRLKLGYTVNAEYGVLPEVAEVKFGRMFLSLPTKAGCVYTKNFN